MKPENLNELTIALAGNPNSGKTTMFNALTGSRQRVGNYPGITVERKEGFAKLDDKRLHFIDLPGCYSLTAYSPEELVARDVILDERPRAVIQVADATALERSLYLTVQFMELGAPVAIALNMMDEAKSKGINIDSAKLSSLLGVPVVETVAKFGRGKEKLLAEAAKYAEKTGQDHGPLEISYGPDVDPLLQELEGVIRDEKFLVNHYAPRWAALKYIEGDERVLERGRTENPEISKRLEARVRQLAEHLKVTLNTYPEAVIADYRYGFINSLLKQGVLIQDRNVNRKELSQKLDAVLTHRLLGPLIMLGVLYGVFYATFTIGEVPMGWLETFFAALSGSVEGAMPEGLLRSLVVSGMIDGVGGVLGFVPLIVVMFLALSFLEDIGYMARVAYMLDRVLRIFGLHGCSVMPFLISGGMPGGCAVPGIMATRTLRSPKEKLATLLTAPFMTCGAKVPVFILLAAAFFPGMEARVMFLATLGAWAMAMLVSLLLRKTLLKGASTPFVMELPPYRLPTLRGLLIHTWHRAWQYIKKAGTVILAISIIIWAAMTFPALPESESSRFESMRQEVRVSQAPEAEIRQSLVAIDNAEAQAALKHSIAGRIGVALEPVSSLAGFEWRTNIALVGGFAAKEVIVSSLGTAYSLGEVDPEESGGLVERIAKDPQWTIATALSLLVFVMFYAPCFVTVVAMARESSWKWAAFSTTFNTAVAFVLAVGVYQLVSL